MTHTATVNADGADLYYERRGTGPAILMISGGGGDAAYYTGVAERLADDYTVLTYDRRGNSRSTVHDPAAPMRIDQQSQDALDVLTHNDLKSALIFGGSGGALIGLDLAARHPAAVDGLIAHEPPVIDLLPDARTYRALFDEIVEITGREGPWPAYVRFITTIDRPDSPAIVRTRAGRWVIAGVIRVARWLASRGPRRTREISRVLGNCHYLMTREVQPFLAFEPDFTALAGSGIPIVLAGGERSRPFYPCRPGEIIAERLGAPFVEFPGGHAGYMEHPEQFAATMRKTLDLIRRPSRDGGG
jgi:acetyltransferase/esterase